LICNDRIMAQLEKFS